MFEVTVFALQAELRALNKSSLFTSLPLKEDFKTYICILFVLVSWLEILNAYLKHPQNCNHMKDQFITLYSIISACNFMFSSVRVLYVSPPFTETNTREKEIS